MLGLLKSDRRDSKLTFERCQAFLKRFLRKDLTKLKRVNYSPLEMSRQADLLTIPEAAKKAKRTPAALYAAIARGDLVATRKFGLKLVELIELSRYRQETKIGRPRNGKAKGKNGKG